MNSNGYLIPVDPSEMASRFPHEDPRFDEEDESLEDVQEDGGVINISEDALADLMSGDNYETILEPLLERIPEREADFIQLYFIDKKKQQDIAEIFEVTQAAVSYRLSRGIKRLQFLSVLPKVTEEELRAALPNVFPTRFECTKCSGDPNCQICHGTGSFYIDVEILVQMWSSTCQSVVASKLGLIQGRVRLRFFNAVRILEDVVKVDPTYEPYQKVFSAIASKKFNILREVKLPQWSDRGGDECF